MVARLHGGISDSAGSCDTAARLEAPRLGSAGVALLPIANERAAQVIQPSAWVFESGKDGVSLPRVEADEPDAPLERDADSCGDGHSWRIPVANESGEEKASIVGAHRDPEDHEHRVEEHQTAWCTTGGPVTGRVLQGRDRARAPPLHRGCRPGSQVVARARPTAVDARPVRFLRHGQMRGLGAAIRPFPGRSTTP
jgi:hypothetical protein